MQQERSFFIMQTELVDAKVEVSVSRAIAPLIEQLANFKQEIHLELAAMKAEFKSEMHEMRQEFGARLSAVETALGMRREKRLQIRLRFLDYTFKTIWLAVASSLSSTLTLLYLHLIH